MLRSWGADSSGTGIPPHRPASGRAAIPRKSSRLRDGKTLQLHTVCSGFPRSDDGPVFSNLTRKIAENFFDSPCRFGYNLSRRNMRVSVSGSQTVAFSFSGREICTILQQDKFFGINIEKRAKRRTLIPFRINTYMNARKR